MKLVRCKETCFIGGHRHRAGAEFVVPDSTKLGKNLILVKENVKLEGGAKGQEPSTLSEMSAADTKAQDPKGDFAKANARKATGPEK